MQIASFLRRNILSPAACLTVPYFSTYLINGMIFGGKKWTQKRVFWSYLPLFFLTFLILRRIKRDTIINEHRSSCHIFIKRTDFRKILKYNILRKSFRWEPRCSMRADGQTDRYYETKSRLLQSLTRLKTVQHSLPCSQSDAEFVLSLQQH